MLVKFAAQQRHVLVFVGEHHLNDRRGFFGVVEVDSDQDAAAVNLRNSGP